MSSTRQALLILLLQPISFAYCIELETEALSSECKDIPKLSVLPGQGWDSLTSEDKGRVVKISYDSCKLSNDGKYLIPDGMEAVVIKTRDLQFHGELIEKWTDYTTTTARGFKVGVGVSPFKFLPLQASFSHEFKTIKHIQVQSKAVASRIQLRNSLYKIYVEPNAKLIDSLKDQFLEVIRAIKWNHTEKAEYLLQVIVRDYGSHFTRSVEAGATIIKEDFLKSDFIRDHKKEKMKITAVAKASLLAVAGFSLKFQYNEGFDTSLLNEYHKATVEKRIKAIGGPNLNIRSSADSWMEGTESNMAAIDRSGDLLTSVITPTKFPNARPMLLKNMYEMLAKAIEEYFKQNTHKGCTKQDSPNFDYAANLDDGSCETVTHDYYFGGVFQNCFQLNYKNKKDECSTSDLYRKNELSGYFMCPPKYSPIQFYHKITKFQFYDPDEECSGALFWKKCWHNLLNDQYSIYSYYCVTSDVKSIGYQFGGIYSEHVDNSRTKEKNCPTGFRTLTILPGNKLTICVRNDVKSSQHYAIPFGGLASCQSDLQCPGGYHGRLATKIDGCQINYCVKTSDQVEEDEPFAEPLLVQPPYLNASEVFQDVGHMDYDDYGEPISSETEANSAYVGVLVAMFSILLIVTAVVVGYWKRAKLSSYWLNVKIRKRSARIRPLIQKIATINIQTTSQ